jgi:hypothetical protein
MKYAIISDSKQDWDTGEWKDFTILIDGLTKEQILALKAAIPEYDEKRKTLHPLSISLSIEGFPLPIRGDDFQEFIFGKIIPMWTLENFE